MLNLRGQRRWVVITSTAVVLAGGTTGAWALTRSSSSSSPTSTLVTATQGTQAQTVATTGTIEPAQMSNLTFSVSGTVTAVAVSVGQKVSKGDVLATVGTTTLQSAVTTASAAVTAASQQLASASGSSATQLASAEAQLAQAQSTLALAQDNLKAASLTAPFSGVVASVGVAVGDVVGSGSSGGSGAAGGSSGGGLSSGSSNTSGSSAASSSSAIILVNTSSWVVNATVGSADLGKLKKGMQAQITPSGATTLVFGTVASIGIVATSSNSGSATFPVVIDVTGSPSGLFAGSTSTVELIVKQEPNVITIPTAAIHTVNGNTIVYKQVNGSKVTTPVTIGTSYGPLTQILSGITAGDQVVVTFTRPGGTGGRGLGGGNGTRTGGGFGGFGGGPGPVGAGG